MSCERPVDEASIGKRRFAPQCPELLALDAVAYSFDPVCKQPNHQGLVDLVGALALLDQLVRLPYP